MAENFKSRLKHIKTLLFDIDGVMTDGKVYFMPDGTPVRGLHNKDSYALHLAAKKGYRLAVISGGSSEVVREALLKVGIADVFLRQHDKLTCYKEYLAEYELNESEILYMGDDLPDYEVMQRVGLPVCPADAATEIKELSLYISSKKGGEGCVRDVVEQVLRVRGDWEFIPW